METLMHRSKDSMIRVAAKLIRHKGYYGFGLKEILETCDLPKGSLYHHFPGGKDELVVEALKYAAGEQAYIFKLAMKGKGDPVNGLKAVVDVLINDFSKLGIAYGCPLASVAMDVGDNNSILARECKAQFEFWIEAVASYLEYKNCSDAHKKASRFMMILEGAIILSQIWQDNNHLENLKDDIGMILKD